MRVFLLSDRIFIPAQPFEAQDRAVGHLSQFGGADFGYGQGTGSGPPENK